MMLFLEYIICFLFFGKLILKERKELWEILCMVKDWKLVFFVIK